MRTKKCKPDHKTCSFCGIERPFNRFNKNPRTKDNLANKCRLCVGKPQEPKLKKIKSQTCKVCCSCKIEKPLSDFYKLTKKKPNYYQSSCKFCMYQQRSKHLEFSNGKFEDPADHPKYDSFLRQQLSIRRLSVSKIRKVKSDYFCTKIKSTVSDFKQYLESKFQEGMTWNNYGVKNGWVLDHIKPLCRFDLSKEEEINEASHYTNVQPLWFYQNSAKRDYYTPGHPMGWSGFDVLLERQAYLTPISVT